MKEFVYKYFCNQIRVALVEAGDYDGDASAAFEVHQTEKRLRSVKDAEGWIESETLARPDANFKFVKTQLEKVKAAIKLLSDPIGERLDTQKSHFNSVKPAYKQNLVKEFEIAHKSDLVIEVPAGT